MIGNLFAGLVRYDFFLFRDCATAAAPKWPKMNKKKGMSDIVEEEKRKFFFYPG